MQVNSGLFQSAGWACYGACVLIVLGLYGAKMYGDRWELDMHEMTMLFMRIGFTGMFVYFYNSPMPYFGGPSGYQLITNLGLIYANQMENGLATRVLDGLAGIYFNMETPWLALLSGVINFQELFTYGIVMLLILVVAAAIIYVIMLGFWATAMCVLIGPLMIPFLIVPGMEYRFWNWFNSLCTYSFFYPVCGYGFLFIFGNYILNFVNSNPQGDLASLGVYAFFFVCSMAAIVGVALKVPSVAAAISSGGGGQSSIWGGELNFSRKG